jgi:hypothetical protein
MPNVLYFIHGKFIKLELKAQRKDHNSVNKWLKRRGKREKYAIITGVLHENYVMKRRNPQ